MGAAALGEGALATPVCCPPLVLLPRVTGAAGTVVGCGGRGDTSGGCSPGAGCGGRGCMYGGR